MPSKHSVEGSIPSSEAKEKIVMELKKDHCIAWLLPNNNHGRLGYAVEYENHPTKKAARLHAINWIKKNYLKG